MYVDSFLHLRIKDNEMANEAADQANKTITNCIILYTYHPTTYSFLFATKCVYDGSTLRTLSI